MSSRQPENERDDAEIPASHGTEYVTSSLQENMSAKLGKDSDPPKSPNGKDIDGDCPKMRRNDGRRSEMVGKPSSIEPLNSAPPRHPVNDKKDRPHQPLATVESPGPKPLQLRPLCSFRSSSMFRTIGPSMPPVRWQKDRKEREEEDRAAMDKLWKADR
ncbi:hypothetical protein FPCIR_11556 [Fusarium pseudocircinatum]|uniref:Uncharacterized protein n=1 Tax=Fusarium pseudocircinatum TaxID=56676 RepID=A0A8H5NWQ8_9HYPO|nr:hypothetical protein FPCIR_11556 [Fusarium pseudocircinatum]